MTGTGANGLGSFPGGRRDQVTLPKWPGPTLSRPDGVDCASFLSIPENTIAVRLFLQASSARSRLRPARDELLHRQTHKFGDRLNLFRVNPDKPRRPGAASTAAGTTKSEAIGKPRLRHTCYVINGGLPFVKVRPLAAFDENNSMGRFGILILIGLIVAREVGAEVEPRGPQATIPLTAAEGGRLYAVAYSPEGRTLAVGGTGKTIYLVDHVAHKVQRTMVAHPDAVWTVAWSPDGRRLFSGGRADPALRVWDPATGAEFESFVGHRGGITTIRVFDGGSKLIIAGGSWDPSLRVWSMADRRLLISMTGHTDLIDALDVTANGRWAVTGSRDGSLRLWDVQRGCDIWSHQVEAQGGHGGYLSVAFSPDGRLFAAGLEDGGLIVRETWTRRRCLPAKERGGETRALAFAPDGNYLAFADASRRIHLFDVRRGQVEAIYQGHRADIFAVAFSPDGRQLASVGADATIYLWRVPSWTRHIKTLTDIERQTAINLLASDNPSAARHALNDLIADSGPRASELVAARLQPTPRDQEILIRRWIDRLASPRFAEREQATEELIRLGEAAEIVLRQTWSQTTHAEQRRRLDRILNRLAHTVPTGEQLQQRRMIAVLEGRADERARTCLRRLAEGGPSWLTVEASEALARLESAHPSR